MAATTDAQEQFWQICERRNAAMVALEAAHREPLDIADADPRVLELTAAQDAMDAFWRDHVGESFKAFRPEWIRAALSDDLQPLSPPEDVP